MLDVLAPEIGNNFEQDKGLSIRSFGLIAGNNYLKNPGEKYGDLSDLKDKNVNV